jgi:Cof subfamily protein (haloacid dehalogenase superfamily)
LTLRMASSIGWMERFGPGQSLIARNRSVREQAELSSAAAHTLPAETCMPIVIENERLGLHLPWEPAGLFVTDLDGTLLRSDRTFSEPDLEALRHLGERGIVRVVATGRSLFSFNLIRPAELPVDYVIFSTGAGVAEYPAGTIVRKVSLEADEVRQGFEVLRSLRLDLMVQRPIPDTHIFGYRAENARNPDFETRISLYRRFAFPLHEDIGRFGAATQLVAIVPPEHAPEALASVRRRIGALSVIRTTSPLDGRSTWIEIFPAGVSKGRAAEWLAFRLGIPRRQTVAVGNDFNDLDLLEWAHAGFVTANAPPDLKARFPVVTSNDEGGVAEAVARWTKAQGD